MSDTHTPARLAVLISGNGSNLQALIDHIEAGRLGAVVAIVISNKADAYGLQRAEQHGITTQIIAAEPGQTREQYDQRLSTAIDAAHADLILLAGFMRILSDEFVTRYLGRMLNIHPSLLPRYKGLDTHQRALNRGDKTHGATVHFVTPTLDDGPIIMQAIVEIKTDDDSTSLANRVLKREHELYAAVIQLWLDQRIHYSDNIAFLDNKPLTTPLILDK